MLDFRRIHQRLFKCAFLPALAAASLAGCRSRPLSDDSVPTPAVQAQAKRPAAPPGFIDPSAELLPADGRSALVRVPSGVQSPSVKVAVAGQPPREEPTWRLQPRQDLSAVSSTMGDRMRSWLADPNTGLGVRWVAEPAKTDSPTTEIGSRWVALPPHSGIEGAGLSIDGQSRPIRWIAPPSGRFDLAAPGGSSRPDNPWLLAALEAAREQPWSWWRAKLASRVLDAPSPVRAGGVTTDSVVLRLADQRAQVWSVALQRLAAADREVARRVAIRLGGAVDFGDGVVAPVWTSWPGPQVPDDGLGLLLRDLLADDLPASERAARARAWIDNLPAAAAWVVDDAGVPGPRDGTSRTTLALANLTDRPAAASVTMRRESPGLAPVEMLTIPPMSVSRVTVNLVDAPLSDRPDAGPDPLAAAGQVAVRIGGWSGQVTTLAAPVPARPPGVPLGPLVRDLDMSCIVAASSGTSIVHLPAIDGSTAGLLQRDADDRWVVYLECADGIASGSADYADVISISFGLCGIGGSVVNITPRGPEVAALPDVRIARAPGRWMCWVPVPAESIESGRWLRLGLVRKRTLAGGLVERTAWPRPIAPWHEQPARIMVDLSAWSK